MADNIINIQQDPQLPEMLKDARRNHGGQTVPQDFFAQFEKKMNAAIDADILLQEAEKKAQQPQIKWYREKRTWMSLAASFLLILVLGIAMQFDQLGHKLTGTTHNDNNVAEIQFEEDDTFLEVPEIVEENYLATTNDYELYEYYCDI